MPARLLAATICLVTLPASADPPNSPLSEPRQITFEGRRAGEGYFSADGSRMVFQSERDPANPFYQIYLMDMETGDVERVSPGFGKTTCAWIHPQGDRVLFASTQDDPAAKEKQADELALRESGKQRRYAWDYDQTYELYEKDLDTGEFKRLTDAVGYDAEASYSPDGSQIVFASNRAAFDGEMTDRERKLFEVDKSFMIDLYIMDADGRDLRRLTDVPGYDGGPFFSPDGSRICWRRFSEDGVRAEVYTMKTDGTDVRRLTEINAMSWAPFFHPSGDYLIFTTNKHGFENFELYIVRADGRGEPVRVTDAEGFDGLPVFLPDGNRLAWTSNRTAAKRSQIFMGDWDDAVARELLGLDEDDEDRAAAIAAAEASSPAFRPTDAVKHVDFLTRRDLGGRMTGTAGERRATAYVAAYLESMGFEPAGDDGTFFHAFEFPAGSTLAENVSMTVGDQPLSLDQDWRPLSFSGDGTFTGDEVVFAGYGMQVPPTPEGEGLYDSYVHLDVEDKWVMVLRDLPQDIAPEDRQRMARYGSPRRKASLARDLGAKGILFVAGPTSKVKDELIHFDANASQAGVSLAAISLSNDVATRILKAGGEDLNELQTSLDGGEMAMGFPVENVNLSATIEIIRNTGTGRNVIARIPAADQANFDEPVVIVGAHVDHLGTGAGSNSLARAEERGGIHYGADDNASGVAAILEIAQYLADGKRTARIDMKRDVYVAAWSGEELGLFGSKAYVDDFFDLYPDAPRAEVNLDPIVVAHGGGGDVDSLNEAVAVYLNLDMVGRLEEKLIVQGIGSSPGFEASVQRRNVPVGLPLQLDRTATRLPTDASAFVARGVPVLSAFTGAHEDYHTPRDTPDKLDYEGLAKIAKLFGLLTRGFAVADEAPPFELDEGPASEDDRPRAVLSAYLGTIPDYVPPKIAGLALSGVGKGGPAEEAGVRGGDIIVKLAGKTIENIHDYTYAIEALKIGETVDMIVIRDGKELKIAITPGSRN